MLRLTLKIAESKRKKAKSWKILSLRQDLRTFENKTKSHTRTCQERLKHPLMKIKKREDTGSGFGCGNLEEIKKVNFDQAAS